MLELQVKTGDQARGHQHDFDGKIKIVVDLEFEVLWLVWATSRWMEIENILLRLVVTLVKIT